MPRKLPSSFSPSLNDSLIVLVVSLPPLSAPAAASPPPQFTSSSRLVVEMNPESLPYIRVRQAQNVLPNFLLSSTPVIANVEYISVVLEERVENLACLLKLSTAFATILLVNPAPSLASRATSAIFIVASIGYWQLPCTRMNVPVRCATQLRRRSLTNGLAIRKVVSVHGRCLCAIDTHTSFT